MAGTQRQQVRWQPGDALTVNLVKQSGDHLRYRVQVVADDGVHVVVRGPFAGDTARDLGFVVFSPGDEWTEHYWRDRWYSVKEVRGGDGTLKGWYCDVARPIEALPDRLVCEDLELDLWVSGDFRTVLRLDEDEFQASGLPTADPDTAAAARRALEELEQLASQQFAGL